MHYMHYFAMNILALFCYSHSCFCNTNQKFPLSGFALAQPSPSNYFRGPTVTFIFKNLQIAYQNITLLLNNPKFGPLPVYA